MLAAGKSGGERGGRRRRRRRAAAAAAHPCDEVGVGEAHAEVVERAEELLTPLDGLLDGLAPAAEEEEATG